VDREFCSNLPTHWFFIASEVPTLSAYIGYLADNFTS
jgi:hypothetical protein